MMNRRAFIAQGALGLVAFAGEAVAQGRKEFVCPPCGCASDGKTFDAPGVCRSCNMPLVEKAALNSVEGIPNFRRLETGVWTAGQPSLDHLSKLKQEGVATIINLRHHSEGGNLGVAEQAKAKELGLNYVNIPVVFGNLQDAAADEFLRITDAELAKGRVLIHCTAAVRVGGFWLIRRVLRDGWTFEKALEEANTIGLGNSAQLVAFARQYIANHQKK